MAADERDFVFHLLNRLTGVTTPDAWLDVISDYPRQRGASVGTLLWIDSDETGLPNQQTVVSRWNIDPDFHPRSGIGQRYPLEDFWSVRGGWFSDPTQPTFIEDAETSPLLDDEHRSLWREMNVRGVVFLPQFIDGRWVGAVNFRWSTPQVFDAADRARFAAILRYASPVINAVRLLQDNRERAQRAEIIASINAALSQARSEDDILSAVYHYASQNGASDISLLYIDNNERGVPVQAQLVMARGETANMQLVGQHFPLGKSAQGILDASMASSNPGDTPAYIEDYEADPRMEPESKALALASGVRAGILMPLRSAGQWQALLWLSWRDPRHFSDQERHIYDQILPSVASAVGSRRALLHAENAQSESGLLYQLAQAINAASSYKEITDAIARIYHECDAVYLNLWEHFDYQRAGYIEVRGASVNHPDMLVTPSGERYPKETIPVMHEIGREDYWIVEDTQSDPRIVPEMRGWYASAHIGATLVSMFMRDGRWIGNIAYYYRQPRSFSEADKRLLVGISDLVLAAVERVRSQLETEEARRQSERDREESNFLYRLAEAVNAATSYQGVIEAVAGLLVDADGVLLDIWEHFDYRKASYFEVLAATAHPESKLRTVGGMRFTEAEFPIISVINKDRLWAIDDTHADPRVDPVTRASWDALDTRAVMAVMLHRGERWLGGISFHYRQPRRFDDETIRLNTGIADLVLAAVDRIRLQVETSISRRRAEESAAEVEFLYNLARDMNAATTYDQMLLAFSRLMPDFDTALLSYPCPDPALRSTHLNQVTLRRGEDGQAQIEHWTLELASMPMIDSMRGQPLWVIEDTYTDPRVDAQSRTSYDVQLGMRAFLGVAFNPPDSREYVGGCGFVFGEPRTFSDRERRFILGVGDLVQAAVARVRAQQETEEARQLAVADREESALLYQLAEAINGAAGYREIAQAVAKLHADCDAVYINLWENLDYEIADFMENIAASRVDGSLPDFRPERVPKSMVPIVEQLRGDRLVVFEDTQTDPRTDEVTRATWRAFGTAAFIAVAFLRGDRYIGFILFNYAQPRRFSDRQRRLAAGIGDLVLAAVERIRSQIETEGARQRSEQDREEAEFLYDLAQEINTATTYPEAAESILSVLNWTEGVFIQVWDHLDYDQAEYYTVAAAALRGQALNAHLETQRAESRIAKSTLRDYYDQVRSWPRPWYVEDAESDPRLSGQVRETYRALNVRATLVVALMQGDRWLGSVSFRYSEPHVFTEREQRIALGVGELVQAAIERISAGQETEAARYRAELMARVSAALSVAADEEAIVAATGEFARAMGAAASYLSYNEGHSREIAVIVAGQRWDERAPEHVVPPLWMSFRAADYPLMRVMMQRPHETLYFEDSMTDSRMMAGREREYVAQANWYAMVIIPCHTGDRFEGSFSFVWTAPQHFDAEARAMFDSLRPVLTSIIGVRRASVAAEAAQRETDAARRRAEILAMVTAALAQATDENGILDALALIPYLPDGYYSSVHYPVFDDDGQLMGFQMQASMLPDGTHAPRDAWMEIVFRIEEYPVLRLLNRYPDQVLYLEDHFSDMRPEFQERLDLARDHGWLSLIAIPLWSAGRWQGNVQFLWREPNSFGDEMRAIFRTLMPVLTSVVSARRSLMSEERARRETELRVQELQTVAQVSAAAVALLDESKLLAEFARLTRARFQPNQVALYLLDEADLLHRTALEDPSQEESIALSSDTLVARAVRQREGLIDRQWVGKALYSAAHPGAVSVHVNFSELAVPMAVRDAVIGALAVKAPEGVGLNESHLRVMSTLADLIAVAVHNVRSYQQAQELAALEERTRLARELHDSVSQALYGIGLGAQTARAMLDKNPALVRQPLEYVLALAQAGLTEMRALIFELRPESLENEGLVTALAKQGASLQARHNITVHLELCDEPRLPLDEKESLYRIAREALHNVVKHASATLVTLRLLREGEWLVLEVIDNGKGFDTGQDFPGHLGLQSMRERVAKLGGTLTIQSTPGAGACISARLPG